MSSTALKILFQWLAETFYQLNDSDMIHSIAKIQRIWQKPDGIQQISPEVEFALINKISYIYK